MLRKLLLCMLPVLPMLPALVFPVLAFPALSFIGACGMTAVYLAAMPADAQEPADSTGVTLPESGPTGPTGPTEQTDQADQADQAQSGDDDFSHSSGDREGDYQGPNNLKFDNSGADSQSPGNQSPDSQRIATTRLLAVMAQMEKDIVQLTALAAFEQNMLAAARTDPQATLSLRKPMDECVQSVLAPICDRLDMVFAPDVVVTPDVVFAPGVVATPDMVLPPDVVVTPESGQGR